MEEEDKLQYHGVNSLRKTELEQFEYYPDACCFFVMDAVIDQDPRPKVREKTNSEPKTATLKVTLLRLTCTVRQYGKHKNSKGVDVWQMVVMDGAYDLFKIIINSRASRDIPHEDLLPGSTILIEPTDYRMIYMQDDDSYQRGLMFIDNFDWEPAPRYDAGDESRSTVTPEFCMLWLDKNAIDEVETKSLLLFTVSWQHEEGFFYWMAMSKTKIRNGAFAKFVPGRLEDWNKKKRKNSVPCDCQEQPYCLEECIATSVPVSSVDCRELFIEVGDKLKGRVAADSFDGLTSSHKRWCLYWYYAVNFLHLSRTDATELPSCFVAEVRKQFPDPDNNYTGFLSRESRQEASLQEM